MVDSSWNIDVEDFQNNIFRSANKVSLLEIFDYYGLSLEDYFDKMICPFSFHNEKTASLYFYRNTNTFWCFGCKTGTKPIDFVSSIDGILKQDAAIKICNIFNIDVQTNIDSQSNQDVQNFVDFSNMIREFRDIFNDEESFIFLENISKVYDELNSKHHLNNDGIIAINKILKKRIEEKMNA